MFRKGSILIRSYDIKNKMIDNKQNIIDKGENEISTK